jgi:hypothetical protein
MKKEFELSIKTQTKKNANKYQRLSPDVRRDLSSDNNSPLRM